MIGKGMGEKQEAVPPWWTAEVKAQVKEREHRALDYVRWWWENSPWMKESEIIFQNRPPGSRLPQTRIPRDDP